MQPGLIIKHLAVQHQNTQIINDISLRIARGGVHAIMGPNGSGKSTFAYALMGHLEYTLVHGSMHMNGTEITQLSCDKRAKTGILLAFQHPVEIPGLTVFNFLREAYNARFACTISVEQFQQELYAAMDLLRIEHAFASRQVNVGFSGGEKKRLEMLQLIMLKPELAILDEIDSGLDIDALALVGRGIAHMRQQHPTMMMVIITHYQRILKVVHPDAVHILFNGKIICSGDATLADQIEQRGYDEFIAAHQQS